MDELLALVRVLRQNPTDTEALTRLLDGVAQLAGAHYIPGEWYAESDGVAHCLLRVGPRCLPQCGDWGCPGTLEFEDGKVLCAVPQFHRPLLRTRQVWTAHALEMLNRLLLRKKAARGSIELPDGRVVHFHVKKDSE